MFKILVSILFVSISLFGVENSSVKDSDNDLISDAQDRCPFTPEGVCVDAFGCTQKFIRVINFDHAVATVSLGDQEKIKNILELAKECFGYTLIINGHTDSVADGQSNLILSKKRAYTIYDILVKNGVKKERLQINWYGETVPIASNITQNGKSKNRRVEILFK